MSSRTNLNKKINKFLEDFSECDHSSGYAPVKESDVAELQAIFRELLALKYEKDSVGELPIEVNFVDKTRYESSHFYPVPKIREGESGYNLADLHKQMRRVTSNLEFAQDRQKQFFRTFDFFMENLDNGIAFNHGKTAYEVMPPQLNRKEFAKEVKESLVEMLKEEGWTISKVSDAISKYNDSQALNDGFSKKLTEKFKIAIEVRFSSVSSGKVAFISFHSFKGSPAIKVPLDLALTTVL